MNKKYNQINIPSIQKKNQDPPNPKNLKKDFGFLGITGNAIRRWSSMTVTVGRGEDA
jgi:hypothetical protein